ncbi:Cytochrome c family protein [hydrothermal vent metagenome]|uniref:Cytochrome c family protein n=1 Tax=hydrothermal vent metagenome TaxID=652676 RepID=A0A1W1EHF5_9ZZZZ
MIRKIILITTLSSIMLISDTNVTNMGKDAIISMAKTLKSTLKGAIKDGGIINGANVCKDSAVSVEKDVNSKLNNIIVRRVTTKPRNIANLPLDDELKVLNEIKKNGSKKLVTVKIDNNHYKVYKPIYMKKVCLACHGDKSKIDKEAYKVIKDNYKNDKAVGYKENEFRGAFIANIILNK